VSGLSSINVCHIPGNVLTPGSWRVVSFVDDRASNEQCPGGYALVWSVMVAAMMLASAVPLLRLFAGVSSRQARAGPLLACFPAAYLAVWALFGWAAPAALMAYEKIGRRGQAVATAAGVLALAMALLVALHPVWLPPFLMGRR
jgi:predicted metal-binding membrane protein